MELRHLEPVDPQRGLYTYKAVVATGPILIQKKDGSRGSTDTFSTVTDGSIAASEEKTIYIGDDENLQVSLGAGDKFYLNKAESGRD